MKEKLYHLLEGDSNFKPAIVINKMLIFLIVLTIISIVLQSYESIDSKYRTFFSVFEYVSVLVFTVEYILRLYISDFKSSKANSLKKRFKHFVSPIAIIDLLAILPFYLPMFIPFDLRFLRLLRIFRLFRVIKLGRYSKAFDRISRVIKSKQSELVSSIMIMIFVLLMAAILMYYAENEVQPDKFSDIPTSVWWAICTLTTVGYGDVYPITVIGKIIASIITVLGIGIIALPTAIISTGFLDEIKTKKPSECPHCGKVLDGE